MWGRERGRVCGGEREGGTDKDVNRESDDVIPVL